MARTAATLEGGTRISDFITLGVVARLFPTERVEATLKASGRTSQRQRDLPAQVVVYYVIALALFTQASCREVLRCLLEGVRWLQGAESELRVVGKSGISQARSRLGWEPLQRLHDELVRPIATKETQGTWYRQWRVVSLDGSTLDVPDDPANDAEFGRPSASRGESAFPQIAITRRTSCQLSAIRLSNILTGNPVQSMKWLNDYDCKSGNWTRLPTEKAKSFELYYNTRQEYHDYEHSLPVRILGSPFSATLDIVTFPFQYVYAHYLKSTGMH